MLAVYFKVTVPDSDAVMETVTLSPTAGEFLDTAIIVVPWANTTIFIANVSITIAKTVNVLLINLFITNYLPFPVINLVTQEFATKPLISHYI